MINQGYQGDGQHLINPISGVFTRDMSIASGNQAVTGLGFKPTAILFICSQNGQIGSSWGLDDKVTPQALIDQQNTTPDTYSIVTADSIYLLQAGATGYRGHVLTLDTDGFTITWTRIGAAAGTLVIAYLAFR